VVQKEALTTKNTKNTKGRKFKPVFTDLDEGRGKGKRFILNS
jgi:hypothetical protein